MSQQSESGLTKSNALVLSRKYHFPVLTERSLVPSSDNHDISVK